MYVCYKLYFVGFQFVFLFFSVFIFSWILRHLTLYVSIFIHLGLYLRTTWIAIGLAGPNDCNRLESGIEPICFHHCRKCFLGLSSWFPHILACPSSTPLKLISLTFFLIGIPGLEVCQHLGLHSHLSHVHCCHHGELHSSSFHKNGAFLHEPVLFSIHVGCLTWDCPSPSSPYHAKNIFVQCSKNFPNACIAQEFFIHGFSQLWKSSVLLIMSFWSPYCHLQSSEICSIPTSTRVTKTGLVFSLKNVCWSFLSLSPWNI